MVFTRLYSWYGKRVVWGFITLIVIIALVGGYFLFVRDTAETPADVPLLKSVTVGKAGDLASKSTALRTVGTVRAVSEARLETESSGRVTAVNVAIGDVVRAGTILATIENTGEYAALLQAEGAYEAALAANAQAGIGLEDVGTSAENAYRSSFATAEDVIRNLVDELISDPTGTKPGIRVDAQGKAPQLSEERVALEQTLQDWNINIANGISGDKVALLTEAEADLKRISAFVTTFSTLVAEMDADEVFTDATLTSYKTRLAGARAGLEGALQSVNGARSALLSAEQSTGGGAAQSESAARIKQAQGVLRSAQAAYEKTLIRTPISGTVNAMYLKANEFIGMSAPAAIVANNGALEITTAIGEGERALIAVGDNVRIDDTFDGIVTHIAPAIDPISRKIEIKISVDEENEKAQALSNGTTVSLVMHSKAPQVGDAPVDLRIPLRALKITAHGPVAFTVEGDGTLKEQPVVLGTIIGDSVLIEEGLSADTVIVEDARGLKDGEKVRITAE